MGVLEAILEPNRQIWIIFCMQLYLEILRTFSHCHFPRKLFFVDLWPKNRK